MRSNKQATQLKSLRLGVQNWVMLLLALRTHCATIPLKIFHDCISQVPALCQVGLSALQNLWTGLGKLLKILSCYNRRHVCWRRRLLQASMLRLLHQRMEQLDVAEQ